MPWHMFSRVQRLMTNKNLTYIIIPLYFLVAYIFFKLYRKLNS